MEASTESKPKPPIKLGETMQTQEIEKPKPKKEALRKSFIVKKIDLETAKQLQHIKDRVNKKNFGRKIKDTDIFQKALSLLTSEHILALQESSYSEKDRLNLAHEEYVKQNGKISLDSFIGLLIRGEIAIKKESTCLKG